MDRSPEKNNASYASHILTYEYGEAISGCRALSMTIVLFVWAHAGFFLQKSLVDETTFLFKESLLKTELFTNFLNGQVAKTTLRTIFGGLL